MILVAAALLVHQELRAAMVSLGFGSGSSAVHKTWRAVMVDFSLLNFFLHIESCGSKNWQSSHGNDVNMTSSKGGSRKYSWNDC